jgi:hypothetical protein
LMKSSLMIWHHVVNVKYTVKILSICVAFLENMNFNNTMYINSIFTLGNVSGNLKGTFEGLWYLVSRRNVHTMVFQTEQILFEVEWFSKNFNVKT